MFALILLAWAAGCVLYCGYSFARLHGDTTGQIGSALMGAGGFAFLFGPGLLFLPSLGLMLVGTLMVLDLVPLPGADAAAAPEDAASSPLLGAVLMLVGLPFLAFSGAGFWVKLYILAHDLLSTSPLGDDPATFVVCVAIGAAGGGLFWWGFMTAGMRHRSLWMRALVLGAPVLTFSWTGLVLGWGLARVSMSGMRGESTPPPVASAKTPAPAARAEAPAAPLTSPDGNLSLSMPPCWKAEARPDRALYAACGSAVLSITETGGPADLASLTARAAKAEKNAETSGVQTEGAPEIIRLRGDQALVYFRFHAGDMRGLEGELTHGKKSYSLFLKNLSSSDTSALISSLDAPAADSAVGQASPR